MKPGLHTQDTVVGNGDEAVRGKVVFINLWTYLPDGTEVPETSMPRSKLQIDLGRRDCFAGLRYGIEGMRVGGRRELVIESHLAYGAKGVPGRIPPHAALRCIVELLEVRERGVVKPEDYPPGRQIVVGWLGDLANGVPKWQFGIHDDGRCGAFLQIPIPDLKWRHACMKNVGVQLDPVRAAAIVDAAISLPKRYPDDCLGADQICVDHSGHDGGVHRLRDGDDLCLAVTILERGQIVSSYYMTESCRAWRESEIRTVVRELLTPALTAQQMGAVLEAPASAQQAISTTEKRASS